MLSTARRASLVVSLVAAAACGGSAPPATAPAAPTDSSAAAATAAPTDTAAPAGSAAAAPADTSGAAAGAWSKTTLSKEQQAAYMKTKVMPAMSPVFKGHDATKYADFGCKTCHGHPFQDPHDFLPHLTFSGGALTQFKTKPEMSKWMHEQVEPGMATAMGQQPYDMKTNTGFGCKGCHTVDMK
jgi:hypothetical protein